MFAKSLVLALLAALSVAAPTTSAPVAQTALPSPWATLGPGSMVSFRDLQSDSGDAPDIYRVLVGTDAVIGRIVFVVNVSNRFDSYDELKGDDRVVISLDTDRNPSTGDPRGSEYVIPMDARSRTLLRWDGTSFARVDAPSLRGYSSWWTGRKNGTSIHPRDLGSITSFDFFLEGFSGDDVDTAPDGPPAWTYSLTSGPIGLRARGVLVDTLSPRRLIVRMTVERHDLQDLLEVGKVGCTLRIGTRSLRPAQRRVNPATCGWNLPRWAKGKLARGTISVTYGETVKRSFSVRIPSRTT